MSNKYSAQRTWSELVGRQFDSKLEARRGEELHLLEMAGEVTNLIYQYPFELSEKPSVKVVLDFSYWQDHKLIFEDAKGVLTELARVKYAWLKQTHNIDVILWRG